MRRPWSRFSLEVVCEAPGRAVLTGKKVHELFFHEAGGHRFQRVPPTEKRGRRQSSTVTVAVTKEADLPRFVLREDDLEENFCRGSGAGGQNRNKRDTCCMLRHKPTGLCVREESERTQESNRRKARERLSALLEAREGQERQGALAVEQRQQRGTGERSDKIRTYQLQRDQAVDHRTDRVCRWSEFRRGRIRLLQPGGKDMG